MNLDTSHKPSQIRQDQLKIDWTVLSQIYKAMERWCDRKYYECYNNAVLPIVFTWQYPLL